MKSYCYICILYIHVVMLVVLDHWMTLFLGPAIYFHFREDFWLLPTVRVNAITVCATLLDSPRVSHYSAVQISLSLVGVIKSHG